MIGTARSDTNVLVSGDFSSPFSAMTEQVDKG